MNDALQNLYTQLNLLATAVRANVSSDEPFSILHGNWSLPGVTKDEIAEEIEEVMASIQSIDGANLGDSEERITDYSRRISFLTANTAAYLPSQPVSAVPAIIITINGLKRSLEPVLNQDKRKENARQLRRIGIQVRSMEAKLRDLEPRTVSITSMVSRIEDAYESADQLPTDLATLSESREQISELLTNAGKDHSKILTHLESASEIDENLKKKDEDASAVLERCETAYSAATSVGLAAAFSERSSTLSTSMWFWIGGLALALACGSFFGSSQLQNLRVLFEKPEVAPSLLAVNLLLSLLSVGAPVWFAWLSTKQIGQRFRLAEDYAFKASIARAYEGFRREAARVDPDMEARLLASALSRLDELPLRLVETQTHGSPWQELASSEAVQAALKSVPGFAEQVKALALTGVATVGAATTKLKSSVEPNKPEEPKDA